MGTYALENSSGKRTISMVYLVLTWTEGNDPDRQGRFTRIGLGFMYGFPGDAGYLDPFRHAETETITIV